MILCGGGVTREEELRYREKQKGIIQSRQNTCKISQVRIDDYRFGLPFLKAGGLREEQKFHYVRFFLTYRVVFVLTGVPERLVRTNSTKSYESLFFLLFHRRGSSGVSWDSFFVLIVSN